MVISDYLFYIFIILVILVCIFLLFSKISPTTSKRSSSGEIVSPTTSKRSSSGEIVGGGKASLTCDGKKIKLHNKWDHSVYWEVIRWVGDIDWKDEGPTKLKAGEMVDIGKGEDLDKIEFTISFFRLYDNDGDRYDESNRYDECTYIATFEQGLANCDFINSYSELDCVDDDKPYKIKVTDKTYITLNIEKK